jgi:hypothetical protein
VRALALLTALAIPALAQTPENGIPGHVRVELQTAHGWVELARPLYDLQQSTQSFSVPAGLAPQGPLRLRLSAPDNDETQIDWVSLEGGKLLSASQHGQSATRKLKSLDRDVAEIHGAPLLVRLQAPQAGSELRFQLAARSSNNASIENVPFRLGAGHLVGAKGGDSGPMHLAAKEGASLRVDTGRMQSASGHPAAPILADLAVRHGRLKGHLDFGLDNDPGDDDYAAILAYDAAGKATEFKVTGKDSRYGKARWTYGPAASWQHMRFDLDVPLAKVPRDAKGGLALELLAYGTCGSAHPDNDFYATGVSAPNVTIPDNLTITVGVAFNVGTASAFSNVPLTSTVWIVDPLGQTLSTQTLNPVQNGGSCAISPASIFYFNPTCSGTYLLQGFVVGGAGDPVPNSPSVYATVVVSGGSACALLTATPSATPTGTPTETPYLSATATPSSTETPVVSATPTSTVVQSLTGAGAGAVVLSAPAQGQPMSIGFEKPISSGAVKVYNARGELVAHADSGGGPLVWDTGQAAVGVYFLRVTATFPDGSTLDTWKKGAILPK